MLLAAAASLTLVWSGPGASHLGAPSPDGRFLSGVHPGTGDLLLRDMASGIRRRVSHPGAARHEHATHSVFSPDSKWVVYTWVNAARRQELRIASVDAPGMGRLLLTANIIQPCAFTPDGSHVLALRDGREIAFVPVAGGDARVVRIAPFVLRRIDLAPDGRTIAFGDKLIDADGSRERRLAAGPNFEGDLAPVFSRDGRRVFVIARDEGLWSVEPGRAPVPMQAAAGRRAWLQGTTRDGRIFLGRLNGEGNVYRASFDPLAGRLTSEMAAIGEAEPVAALAPQSGRYLARGRELWRENESAPAAVFPRPITALAVAPGPPEFVAVAQSTTLTVISPAGRAESRAASETISGLAWIPGGSHLITVQNDSLWWWSASLENFRRIVKTRGTIGSLAIAPDGRSLTFTLGMPRSEVWSLPIPRDDGKE